MDLWAVDYGGAVLINSSNFQSVHVDQISFDSWRRHCFHIIIKLTLAATSYSLLTWRFKQPASLIWWRLIDVKLPSLI